MEYCILTADEAVTLETQVRDKLRQGWVPWGGVSVATFGDAPVNAEYAQAMVKQFMGVLPAGSSLL